MLYNHVSKYHIQVGSSTAKWLILASVFTECLEEEASFYSREDVFPAGTIDNLVRKLKAYDDKDLSERLYHKTEETRELVNKYLHCM